MYKFVTLFALVACAVAAPAPGLLHSSPIIAQPAVAVAHSVPVATSYANTYKVDNSAAYIAQPAYTYQAAPVVAHAPVHVAHSAAYSVHPASYTYAHASPVYLH
ncbi:cuticle protein 38-like [Chelonus insularis]|uniref:cuticle protein 38-like n=1 Tax=Chelonus insularis TaxID=460826 RepID=UPI00158B3021|nr:cuticle protein 38-like [Chelonus insularis]